MSQAIVSKSRKTSIKTSKKSGETFSISQLEQMIQQRRSDLGELTRKREQVVLQLAEIDAKITGLGGGVKGAGVVQVTAAGRARNKKSLIETMKQVLVEAGNPLMVGQILDAVHATGYRSNSSSFRAILNQTLIKERKIFEKVARGQYDLRKATRN